MSFFSQTLLLKCQQLNDRKNKEKRLKVYKRQKIDGSKDEERRLKIYKRQQIDRSENKERLDLTD